MWIFRTYITLVCIILIFLLSLLIYFTYGIYLKSNGTCEQMKNWSMQDLPVRCIKELKLENIK